MVKTSRPEKWRTTYFRSDFWRPLPWRAKPDRGQHEGKNTEKHILRVNTLNEKEPREVEKLQIELHIMVSKLDHRGKSEKAIKMLKEAIRKGAL